ncbi:terminase small subunit [Shigella phage phi2457T]|uniref:Terminase small subunit n=1 Tax=Shigella phage phi2457T TaxID=2419683 RepID=A0A3G3BYJ7_9CAUD|nr:terminase small subunit [Shigella phage phi2457T]
MSEPKNAPVVQGGNFKELYKKKFGTVLAKNRTMTPEQLFDLSVKYFEWAEDNAIKASESASFQGGVYESLVHKPRVFTWTGYRLFIGASEAAIIKWKREEEYSEVMEFVESVINEQKFQLAANGVINASFIGKDLGIDKPASINIENSAASASTSVATTEDAMKEAVNSILDML